MGEWSATRNWARNGLVGDDDGDSRPLARVSEKTRDVHRNRRPARSECGWLGDPRKFPLKEPTARTQSAQEAPGQRKRTSLRPGQRLRNGR